MTTIQKLTEQFVHDIGRSILALFDSPKNKHHGSSFESFLKGESIFDSVDKGARRRAAPFTKIMGGLRDMRTYAETGKGGRVVAACRKGPIQLCPAPGCKERAAPVFGMLCKKHKDAKPAQVRVWRAARRARKAK